MDAKLLSPDATVPQIAAAIAAPARTRMLYSLMDGRARTSTELALLADVTPSTASIHLQQLRARKLVSVTTQGKHRCYTLAGTDVAAALEALSSLAGRAPVEPAPAIASSLRVARSCYDHIAGALGVALYSRLVALGWLSTGAASRLRDRDLTARGANAISELGIDVDALRARRRRFAHACLDWTERRPHLGGALGAALLENALKRKWVVRERDSRALSVTARGDREIFARFGVRL
ncbi:MAG: ArsR/SmtB family transcription factor [Gemmatimonadales bacterium]